MSLALLPSFLLRACHSQTDFISPSWSWTPKDSDEFTVSLWPDPISVYPHVRFEGRKVEEIDAGDYVALPQWSVFFRSVSKRSYNLSVSLVGKYNLVPLLAHNLYVLNDLSKRGWGTLRAIGDDLIQRWEYPLYLNIGDVLTYGDNYVCIKHKSSRSENLDIVDWRGKAAVHRMCAPGDSACPISSQYSNGVVLLRNSTKTAGGHDVTFFWAYNADDMSLIGTAQYAGPMPKLLSEGSRGFLFSTNSGYLLVKVDRSVQIESFPATKLSTFSWMGGSELLGFNKTQTGFQVYKLSNKMWVPYSKVSVDTAELEFHFEFPYAIFWLNEECVVEHVETHKRWMLRISADAEKVVVAHNPKVLTVAVVSSLSESRLLAVYNIDV